MKKLILMTFLLILGCAQLKHGQEQPVKQISLKDNIYFTTCAGAAEGWSDCYAKAHRACPNEYTILSKFDNNKGTQRDLTFQCKK